MSTLDAFTRSYVDTALWLATDPDGNPADHATIAMISPDQMATIVEDCADFQASFGALFPGREEKAGHNFFLTRNRHGAGFWDGDWTDPLPAAHHTGFFDSHSTIGDFLTAMAHPYGEFNLDIAPPVPIGWDSV